MVAVGGSIGTGLLLGSAAALEIAGPGVILSYIIAAFIAYTVAMALGELASKHPAAGSFGVYGEIYLNQYLGFLCRAAYWASIAFSIGAELVASATYMTYWLPAVPGEIWVIVFSAVLLLINLRSVGSFGRFEFWFSMIKFATIVAFILAGAALMFGGHVTLQYTTHGGFFPKDQSRRCWPSFSLSMLLAGWKCSPSRLVSRVLQEIFPGPHASHFFCLLAFIWGDHCSRRRDAMESRRRYRESIRQRSPAGENSGRSILHEFRGSHGRALGSERQTLRRIAAAVFHGPHRMGSRQPRQA